MKSTKLFLATGIVLLLFIYGESLFYLGLHNKKQGGNIEKEMITPTLSINQSSVSGNNNNTAMLLLQNLKKSIDLAQKNILVKSQKTDIYESQIAQIELSSGKKNSIKYDAFLSLKYKENENYTFYLTKNDLQKVKVYSNNNNRIIPYEWTKLQKGDQIRVEFITNVLEYFDKNTEQIIITKLK